MFEEAKANLPQVLEEKTKQISEELANYSSLSAVEINSIISRYSLNRTIKNYTAVQLSELFTAYQDMIIAINKKTSFIPTIKNFCSFIGISSRQYENWMISAEPEKAEIMAMIDDYISDSMLGLAQNKQIDNITTIFRAKSEHGMYEKTSPIVIEHHTEVNLDAIKQKIAQIKGGKSSTIELKQTDYQVEDN